MARFKAAEYQVGDIGHQSPGCCEFCVSAAGVDHVVGRAPTGGLALVEMSRSRNTSHP